MKEVRISLSEQRLAEVEAEVASGQFASVSDLVDRAFAEYFAHEPMPTEAEMVAELAAMREEVAAGRPAARPRRGSADGPRQPRE